MTNQENKKVLAGVLALIFGYLGVHKFVLGYTKEGIIQLVLSFVSCGVAGIIPFVEGIIYLTKSNPMKIFIKPIRLIKEDGFKTKKRSKIASFFVYIN